MINKQMIRKEARDSNIPPITQDEIDRGLRREEFDSLKWTDDDSNFAFKNPVIDRYYGQGLEELRQNFSNLSSGELKDVLSSVRSLRADEAKMNIGGQDIFLHDVETAPMGTWGKYLSRQDLKELYETVGGVHSSEVVDFLREEGFEPRDLLSGAGDFTEAARLLREKRPELIDRSNRIHPRTALPPEPPDLHETKHFQPTVRSEKVVSSSPLRVMLDALLGKNRLPERSDMRRGEGDSIPPHMEEYYR